MTPLLGVANATAPMCAPASVMYGRGNTIWSSDPPSKKSSFFVQILELEFQLSSRIEKHSPYGFNKEDH